MLEAGKPAVYGFLLRNFRWGEYEAVDWQRDEKPQRPDEVRGSIPEVSGLCSCAEPSPDNLTEA